VCYRFTPPRAFKKLYEQSSAIGSLVLLSFLVVDVIVLGRSKEEASLLGAVQMPV
jgi:hypothetical protein